MRVRITLAIILGIICRIHAFGNIWHVPGDIPTIQAAIDAAAEGDEIIVGTGLYNENVQFKGKNITLHSTDPASSDTVNNTIIDGGGIGSVITFAGTESASCCLAGFTIKNGQSSNGGGIMGKGTKATIQDNVITSNSAIGTGYNVGMGGGIGSCQGVIQRNVITNNMAQQIGGGIYNCNWIIQNNTISSNNSSYTGGGISSCHGLIRNNLILKNEASGGGGISSCNGLIQSNIIRENNARGSGGGLYYCEAYIRNNLILGNKAYTGGGIDDCYWSIIENNTIYGNFANSGGGLYSASSIIINCIIWDNTAIEGPQLLDCSAQYSCIMNGTSIGKGNIAKDPQFENPDNGDFHLKPISPCIDAGIKILDMNEDFEGDPRPVKGTHELQGDGSCYDIGADEFIPQIPIPTPTPTPIPTPTPTSSINHVPSEYQTIQSAIDASQEGDVIIVEEGTYKENIHFKGKNITLRSTDPTSATIVAGTVIDGGLKGTVVKFDSSETRKCVLSGFSIERGKSNQYEVGTYMGASGYGGGIYCSGASPTIINNIIRNNKSFGGGGRSRSAAGIYWLVNGDPGGMGAGGGICCINQSLPLISNNQIYGNLALGGKGGDAYGISVPFEPEIKTYDAYGGTGGSGMGGGIYCGDSSPVIEYNQIFNNNVEGGEGGEAVGAINNTPGSKGGGDGGGICCYYFSVLFPYMYSPVIAFNDIRDNSNLAGAGYSSGGGIYCMYGSLVIYNNKILRNNGGGIYCYRTSLSIYNNMIFHNNISYNKSLSSITNNTIVGNGYGTGIYTSNSQSIISNNIIAIHAIGFTNQIGYPILKNNNFFNPNGKNYNGLSSGMTDISSNPFFIDASKENYHIMGYSPCIDAGDDSVVGKDWTDIDGEPRIYGKHVDIGADEYSSPLYVPDTIRAHILGIIVLSGAKYSEADINHDGIVNVADLVMFLKTVRY